jgi:glycosyltransferase involved in cell wall biosynthesis
VASADKERPTIAGIVITKDEERNVANCLDSLRWVDDLVVVDAESTDRTVELAKKFTSKVFVRPWPGYGPQKNFAMDQTMAEWLLIVDADERVSPELRQEIMALLEAQPDGTAYRIPRRNFYYGYWIRHAGQYPDPQLRLLRRGTGRYNTLPVHEHLDVKGPVGDLVFPLEHHTHPTVLSHELKIERYSSLAAGERIRVGNDAASWYHLLVNPLWTFLKLYVFRGGIRDGLPGFLVCGFSAAHVLLKYAKLWEHQHAGSEAEPGTRAL